MHPVRSNKKYVLGIDIGGTGIKAKLFEVSGSNLPSVSGWESNQNTNKGLDEHVRQITAVVREANKYIREQGAALVGIGIASPGRFDEFGHIKPGTNTNLELTKGEFDSVNLKEEYSRAISDSFAALPPLYVCNDGNAMLAGMMDAIRTQTAEGLVDQNGKDVTKFGLAKQHVALFGIGTGVGHAIVNMDISGNDYKFVTDGHASKLRVKIDSQDWPMVEKAMKAIVAPDKIIAFPAEHEVRAEDLFRAPVINALADGYAEPDNAEHQAVLRFAGKYMARTIALIKSGQSQDVDSGNAWSDADKAEAAKTSVYLIGGKMGTRPIGKKIIEYAAAELKALNIDDVKLVQFKGDDNPQRQAALLVPPAEYRGGPAVAA